jgi:precorrin-2 C(20)-methyltransferase
MSGLGKFFGVGIGPGDPELLTHQAARLLNSVPVIFVPKAKITDEGMALQILLNSVVNKTGAELRELVFPMSKDPAVLKPAWALAREAVLETLRQGKDCAFITLGDTAIYSTYMNLLAELRAAEPGLAIQTAAGISSFSAGAAMLNLSLCANADPECANANADTDLAIEAAVIDQHGITPPAIAAPAAQNAAIAIDFGVDARTIRALEPCLAPTLAKIARVRIRAEALER